MFDAHFRGDVLELACGPGTWTAMLAQRAASVTAVDGAPEMLREAAASAPGENVTFVQADLFSWRPERRYDAIFFGFWLSHVPDERFDAFWSTVADALAPGGHVVFVDDAYRTPEELIYGEDSPVILRDGDRAERIPDRQDAAHVGGSRSGWPAGVELCDDRAGPFFWGLGTRAPATVRYSPS